MNVLFPVPVIPITAMTIGLGLGSGAWGLSPILSEGDLEISLTRLELTFQYESERVGQEWV